jgi:hypothetical protein
MTTNEVRALASLQPVEGGDVVPALTPAAIWFTLLPKHT